MQNYFSSNLEYLRKKYGISKSELAKKMNVNQSTISRWENGQMGITVDKAYDLSIILNTPLPILVGKDLKNYNPEVSRSESDFIKEKIDKLNDNQKDAIINIIDNMK